MLNFMLNKIKFTILLNTRGCNLCSISNFSAKINFEFGVKGTVAQNLTIKFNKRTDKKLVRYATFCTFSRMNSPQDFIRSLSGLMSFFFSQYVSFACRQIVGRFPIFRHKIQCSENCILSTFVRFKKYLLGADMSIQKFIFNSIRTARNQNVN